MSAYPCCCDNRISTECCAVKVSRTLILTVNASSTGCFEAFETNDYTLTYNSVSGKWEGVVEGLDVNVWCKETSPGSYQWVFSVVGDGACSVVDSPFNPTQQCEPFLLQFGTSADGGTGDCCTTAGGVGTGVLVFEITEG